MTYNIEKKESNQIKIIKTVLVFMILFIHSNKSEIHFSESNIILEVPVWLEIIKYSISNVICRSAVPLYFVISAILLYRKDFSWNDNIKKKIRRLLFPYVIFNTIWIVIFYVSQNISVLSRFFASSEFIIQQWSIADWINAFLGLSGYPFAYHLWFLRDLFVLNCLSIFIKKVIDRFPKFIFVITILFWLSGNQTGLFLLSREAIVFWILGYYIIKSDFHIDKIMRFNPYLVCLTYILLLALDVLLKNGMIYKPIHNLTILFGCIFWIRILAPISEKKTLNRCIGFLSMYSFGVFLMHEYLLKFSLKIGVLLLPNNSLFQLLEYCSIPLLVYATTLLVNIYLNRLLPGLYKKIVNAP